MLRRGELQLNREGGPLPLIISGLLTMFLHFPLELNPSRICPPEVASGVAAGRVPEYLVNISSICNEAGPRP